MLPLDYGIDGCGPHILLVDDDDLFVDTASRLLVEAGYRVASVLNGPDAEIALRQSRFDLIILDCGLKGRSELELMNMVTRQPDPTPVLIVSARRGDWHRRVLTSYGAAAVLEKPACPAALMEAVRGHLAKLRQGYE